MESAVFPLNAPKNLSQCADEFPPLDFSGLFRLAFCLVKHRLYHLLFLATSHFDFIVYIWPSIVLIWTVYFALVFIIQFGVHLPFVSLLQFPCDVRFSLSVRLKCSTDLISSFLYYIQYWFNFNNLSKCSFKDSICRSRKKLNQILIVLMKASSSCYYRETKRNVSLR